MATKIFPMVGAFKVHTSIAPDFQKWMEEDHFKKMHDTGHFDRDMSIGLPPSEPDKDGMVTLIYIHEVGSTVDWEEYSANDRPYLRQEFMEQWGEAAARGLLVSIVGAGMAESLTYAEPANA